MDYLRQYALKNKIKLKLNGIKSKYLCKICGDILHHPMLGRCGCRYCSECLNQSSSSDTCPSCYQSINVEKDVVKDLRLEMKITDIIIFCPNTLCTEQVKISQIEEHLKGCTKIAMPCLFKSLGYTNSTESTENMHKYKTKELTDHLGMLLTDINSNNNVKDEKMDILEKTINGNIATLDGKMQHFKDDLRIVNDVLEGQFEELKHDMTKLVNEQTEQEMKKRTKNVEIVQSCAVVDNSFKFTFREISKKTKNTVCYSDILVINGYHFKIGMRYNSNGLIDFRVYLVKSSDDDNLEWPFKRTLTFSILRSDKSVHVSSRFNHETSSDKCKQYYNKPTGGFIEESNIAGYDTVIIDNDTVSVILSMLH